MPRHRPKWHAPDDPSRVHFLVKCSDGHGDRQSRAVGRGVLATVDGGPPAIEWTGNVLPELGEPKPDGDRKVTLKCRTCTLDRQVQASLLIRALQGLAAAGMKDRAGRVVIDIAHVPR